MKLAAIVAALCALFSSQLAHAQIFVIAPPWHMGSDGKERSEQVARVIEQDVAKQNGKALAPERAAALVPEEYREACSKGACAERFRAAYNAHAAIVIRVYRLGEGEGPATSFQIGIQPETGLEYVASSSIDNTPFDELALRTFREAQRAYQRGPGPWLYIEGAPKNADLFIDDKPVVLKTPLNLSVGTHRVRVQANGFEPANRIVSFASPSASQRLFVNLKPSTEQAPSLVPVDSSSASSSAPVEQRRSASWPSIALFSVGGASALIGAGLIGVSVREQNESDDCDALSSFPCSSSNAKTYRASGIALTAVGVTAIVAGIFLRPRVTQKTHISLETSHHHALLAYRRDL